MDSQGQNFTTFTSIRIFLNKKITYIRNFSMHFTNQFFIFYFDSILTYFMSPHFSFFFVIDVMLSFQKSITNP